jgi:hypothetical protein
MANELLIGQATPARLHAMVRLISRLQHPTKKEIFDLMQPLALVSDQQSAVNTIFTAAKNSNIITENPDKTITLNCKASQLESVESFRLSMQKRVLGITDQNHPNYRLNLYSAWYIVQNEWIFQFIDKDFETRFNEELSQGDDDEARKFNSTKFNGWRTWAAFLGLGWLIKPRLSGRSEILVPCASNRLKGVLNQLLPGDQQVIKFSLFAQRLAELCPELDGGSLFIYCWEASHGSEQRGNNLSLALSAGLRQLHDSGEIELIRQADATDIWQLYPAEGHLLKQVTHIRLREN